MNQKRRRILLYRLLLSRYALVILLWYSLLIQPGMMLGSLLVGVPPAAWTLRSVVVALSAAFIIWLARRRWLRLYNSSL